MRGGRRRGGDKGEVGGRGGGGLKWVNNTPSLAGR